MLMGGEEGGGHQGQKENWGMTVCTEQWGQHWGQGLVRGTFLVGVVITGAIMGGCSGSDREVMGRTSGS